MTLATPLKYFDVRIFSHHFVINNTSPGGQQLVDTFARNYIQFGLVKVGRIFKRMPIKVFAAKTLCKNETRFHIGQYKEWKRFLLEKGIPATSYTEAEIGYYETYPLNCEITKEKTPRDYQIEINTYNMSPLPSRRKFVGIQPGKGKTFIASWMAAQLNGRIVSFLKPEYLEKWPGDLEELLGIAKKETLIIQGSASLMAVISAAKNDTLDAKAILVSNRTFQNYIQAYEKHGDQILEMGYDCLPHEFCQVIQAKLRIIDEVHKDFHCNFKIDLYTHIEWSISLTATLISDDEFITKMHEIAYPKEERSQVKVEHKYVRTNAMLYKIINPDKLRTSEFGSNNYSHIAFEKNFFKNDYLLQAYLEFIADRFEAQYLVRAEKGQRCLIYAASIQMCTLIANYLREKYRDLTVNRFVEDDPYENLMDSDVCVSTIGSAGTGHDIKNLITVLLTVAIASTASNIQGFGRLRFIPDVETVFEYLSCIDVAKHMEYHHRKEDILRAVAKYTAIEELSYTLGAR